MKETVIVLNNGLELICSIVSENENEIIIEKARAIRMTEEGIVLTPAALALGVGNGNTNTANSAFKVNKSLIVFSDLDISDELLQAYIKNTTSIQLVK